MVSKFVAKFGPLTKLEFRCFNYLYRSAYYGCKYPVDDLIELLSENENTIYGSEIKGESVSQSNLFESYLKDSLCLCHSHSQKDTRKKTLRFNSLRDGLFRLKSSIRLWFFLLWISSSSAFVFGIGKFHFFLVSLNLACFPWILKNKLNLWGDLFSRHSTWLYFF